MKHQHFDVGTAGFYGAYWACAGGSDCAVIAMIGDDPEDRLARSDKPTNHKSIYNLVRFIIIFIQSNNIISITKKG